MNNNFTDIKRILVLGHTGFIGSHLEKYLKKQLPKIEVIGMSSASVDLTKKKDVLKLRRLFDLKTIVIMCSTIKRQFSDNQITFSKNLKMVMNICNVLRDRHVKRFVFISSAAVYGEDIQNMNITEDTNVHPTSYYGMAKYISECLLHKVFENQKQSSLLILRPPLIYGPGEKVDTYGPTGFVKAALKRKKITLWGDGRERREFIFIRDFVKIMRRLSLHNCNGTLNIVSGENCSFIKIIKVISRLLNYKIQVTSQPRTKKKVDHRFNNLALMRILDNFTFTSFEDGLKKTIAAEMRGKYYFNGI